MPYQLVNVAPDPNAAPFSLTNWLDGHKTYIVLILSAAKVWYAVYMGQMTVDTGIDATMVLMFGGAIRSAIRTSTAQVVNATVKPTSPAALKQAASVPEPPKEIQTG